MCVVDTKQLAANVEAHSHPECTVLWVINCTLFKAYLFIVLACPDMDTVLLIHYLFIIFYITGNKSFISTSFFFDTHLSIMQLMLLGFIRLCWPLSRHSWHRKGASSQQIWIQEPPLLLIHDFKVTLQDSHIWFCNSFTV